MSKHKKQKTVKVGDSFGILKVLDIKNEILHTTKRSVAYCKCKCGNKDIIKCRTNRLVDGTTSHCGCKRNENLRMSHTGHKLSRTRQYHIWSGMMSRCYKKNNPAYKWYGERGIFVATEWHDFCLFNEWTNTNGFKKNLTIERIDVNGNYCPENCTWILQSEQSKNRRCTVKIEAFNETKLISEWEKDSRCKVGRHAISSRIKRGWEIEDAISLEKSAQANRRQTLVTAFGETKNISEWANDRRCVVSYSGLRHRISIGWIPEIAISKKSQKSQKEQND